MTNAHSFDDDATVVTRTAADDGRLAGLALVALASGFLTVMMLAAAMAPNYDFGGGAISDLGVVAETALLFNAALVVAGALNVAAGYLLFRASGETRLRIPVVFAVAGVGIAGVGVFPLDTGGLHGLFALVAFVLVNVEAVLSATLVRGVMRVLSVVAGVVGLAFVVLMAVGDAGTAAAFGPIGHGGTERMIVYPVMLWMLVFGGYLLGTDVGDSNLRRGTDADVR